MAIHPNRYVRRREAAAYAGVSAGFLEKAAVRGDGPPFIKVGTRLVVYDREMLDRWLAERSVRSTGEVGQE